MAIRVRLANKSQITKSLGENLDSVTTGLDRNLIAERSIYQRLGSLVFNKTISDDYNNDRLPAEYKEFLDAMNALHAQIKTIGSSPDDIEYSSPGSIALIDEWLGSLGINLDYRYSKDFVNIPQWIDMEGGQTEYRILVDKSDNTYLTDSNGNEVLVSYTGVTNAI